MFRHIPCGPRSFRGGAIVVAAWLGVFVGARPALAVDIVRVEEDWELQVATPDPGSDAPQVTCLFSPTGDVRSVHAAFELNQRSLPSFSPGGLQLQLWNGEVPQGRAQAAATGIMGQPDEIVRWTQSMEIVGGVLKFAVTGGSSTTWGEFGGDGLLKIEVGSELTNLNQYDPQVSVDNTAVGYASNRVKSLVLKRIRVFTSTGDMAEDATPRPVQGQP